jgi:hypothetical protein
MSSNLSHNFWVAFIFLGALAAVIIFIIGIYCLIRYWKTRRKALLFAGLIMTFLLPGCLLYLVFLVGFPNAFMAYGPPPSNDVP